MNYASAAPTMRQMIKYEYSSDDDDNEYFYILVVGLILLRFLFQRESPLKGILLIVA